MNAQFAIAGALALIGAAIHGGLGQRLVVARLPRLEPTPFGGPGFTRMMIVATWHVVTLSFATFGVGLGWCAAGGGAACSGVGRVAGTAFGTYAALVFGLALRSPLDPRMFVRHPAPLVFVAIAALAWWGA